MLLQTKNPVINITGFLRVNGGLESVLLRPFFEGSSMKPMDVEAFFLISNKFTPVRSDFMPSLLRSL